MISISILLKLERLITDNPYQANAATQLEEFFSAAQLEKLAGLRFVSLIIVSALILGCVSFFALSLLIAEWENASWTLSMDSPITMLAIAGAAMGIVASQAIQFFIYKKTPMTGNAPTDPEIDAAQMQFNTELIVRSALLESLGFFCLIAWFIEANYWALIAAGLCVIFLVAKLPNESKHLHDIRRRLTDRS